jgi:hypothetical protein
MLSKVYKTRVWIMLLMLVPFIGYTQPAGWDFTLNPTWATYTITTGVTFDGVDALVPGDWIGVFYEDAGELYCAGYVQWSGSENIAITAFGNDDLEPEKNGFADGELIQWKFYYQANQLEVCVKAFDQVGDEFYWSHGNLDLIGNFGPCVELPTCITINLSTGTSLISSYIEADDLNFLAIMTGVLGNLSIAKNSAGATLRKIGPNWVNSIGNWVVTEGYSVRMNGVDVLEICGQVVPYDTEIPVSGTKLVAFLHDSPMNAVAAFQSILGNLAIAKNSSGATLRKIGPNWVNSIGNLNPGEGYSVRMNNPDILIYPPMN